MSKFYSHMNSGFSSGISVSFETNYHADVSSYIDQASASGFVSRLIFIGLKDVELAKARVTQRVESGGHFVNDKTIKERYFNGLKNLDTSFFRYDRFSIIESFSDYKSKLCISSDDVGVKLFQWPTFVDQIPVVKKFVQEQIDSSSSKN